MPSKPIENLPLAGPLADVDEVHIAQWNGAGFDSRKKTLLELATYFALAAGTPLLTMDTVAGTSYVFAAENYHHKRFTAATAVTATVPPNATVPIPVGTRIRCTQAGAGQVVLTPGAGVTLNSRDGALKSTGQFAVFEIEKVGTDEWDVLGDVTA